jgi:tetratricopeptide (TPR) repeat protein
MGSPCRNIDTRKGQGDRTHRTRDGTHTPGTVASHLVKVDSQTAGWWISLAYAVRRTESVEKAEAILLRAQAIHPKVAIIAFNLACYASVTGRIEDAKARLRHAIELDKDIRELALDDEDLKPLWNWIASLE